ncbi:MAG: deoxyguanosinetriphosphate triphosphohydrolase [Candidatus Sumerlaeia bacterium]|nr:deoxyguanosinetriphosphate triphosphohydrolase [Candidatus Sumerlaeia bacterium]
MIIRRQELEQDEKRMAPYACRAVESRGRDNPIAPDLLRTDFQRDRDRVIHTQAFRKLEFKTQVFVVTASDYHRTRLTHTMEVAQIARTLARSLGVNPDLSEAIALAHDLGHTPFGHAGEDAMRECMKDHGGFEHNSQSLRIIEFLEERYPDYPGLNLTFEVREGIIKHDTQYDKPSANPRFLPGKMATLEAQVVDLADEIAYNCADLDDALKMGYIEEEDLREVEWLHDLFDKARSEAGVTARQKYVRFRALGYLYDAHVNSAIDHTGLMLEKSGVASTEEVREYPGRLVDFDAEFKERIQLLKDFLLQRVYFHPKTLVNSERGKRFIVELFNSYLKNPRLMPFKFQKKVETEGAHRVVCDYISGMTDRYLHEQYRALFHPEVFM